MRTRIKRPTKETKGKTPWHRTPAWMPRLANALQQRIASGFEKGGRPAVRRRISGPRESLV